MEGQVLAIAGHDLAITLQALFDRRTIAALMLDETLGANIDNMIPRGLAELRVPSDLSNRLSSVQVFDGFIDGGGAFLRAERRLSWLAQRVALETAQHLLEVRDEAAWVGAQSVL